MSVKLSVCVPVYGVEAYVERCVRSLCAQTFADIELVFVDDCSPDASMDVVRRCLGDYPAVRVRILRHEVHRGPATARMTARAAAAGEWIGHCDADDWVEPDYFEKLISAAESAKADMAYASIRREFPSGRNAVDPFVRCSSGAELTEKTCPSALFNACVNKIVRREIALTPDVETLSDVTLGEDLAYACQIVPRCGRILDVPDAVYHYRQHDSSLTHSANGVKRAHDLYRVCRLLERVLSADRFSAAVDRFRRDVLLSALKFGGMRATEYAALRNRLRTPLLSDPRHGPCKRGILAFADFSYPLARSVGKTVRRLTALKKVNGP